MVLSKGKKMILIVVLALVVLVGGFFAFRSYQETRYQIKHTVDNLFLQGYTYSYADPYDGNTVDAFMEEFFNPVRDKRSFKKELISVTKEYAEVGLHNSFTDEDEMQTRYGEALSDTQVAGLYEKVLSFLQQAGYEDADLRDIFTQFYATDAQRRMEAANSGSTEQIEKMNTLFLSVVNANKAGGEFYQVSPDALLSAEQAAELTDLYRDHAEQAMEENDRAVLLDTISYASSFLPDLQLDETAILDFLTNDHPLLLTLSNEAAGTDASLSDYNILQTSDEVADMSEYSTSSDGIWGQRYGDFASIIHRWTTKNHQYDTSAMTPGLWDALTPGQQAEIRRGNSSSTSTNIYEGFLACFWDHSLTSENRDSTDPSELFTLQQLVDDGCQYAYYSTDNTMVFVAPDAIYYVDMEHDPRMIAGDYSAILEQMENAYQKNKEDGSYELNRTLQTLINTYSGVYEMEDYPLFRSAFESDGETIYWVVSPFDEEDTLLNFSFYVDDKKYSFFQNPVPVVDNRAYEEIKISDTFIVTGTVLFEDNAIKYSMGPKGKEDQFDTIWCYNLGNDFS